MKNIFRKIAALAFATFTLMGVNSCVKDDFDTPPIPQIPIGEVSTIADLLAFSTESPYKFTDDQSVYGIVSMGGTNGNIYKEAYMQDATSGIN